MQVVAWDVRSAVFARLLDGATTRVVADELGVAFSSVKLWARLAGMSLPRGRGRGINVRALSSARGDRSYRRLMLVDRSVIQAARSLDPPMSIRAIAVQLGVAPSTVSRELRAHPVLFQGEDRYDASVAHYRAMRNRVRRRPVKLEPGPLRAEVLAGLNNRYSPQQVAGDLRVRFPGQEEMHVSHETIYQALYLQGKGALRHELTVVKALRTGRTGRIPQSKLPRRSNRPWLDGARLSDRPADAADRAVPGHWEGDLVVGPGNSGIITLVERSTR